MWSKGLPCLLGWECICRRIWQRIWRPSDTQGSHRHGPSSRDGLQTTSINVPSTLQSPIHSLRPSANDSRFHWTAFRLYHECDVCGCSLHLQLVWYRPLDIRSHECGLTWWPDWWCFPPPPNSHQRWNRRVARQGFGRVFEWRCYGCWVSTLQVRTTSLHYPYK